MKAHDGMHITDAEVMRLQEKERENPNLRNLVNGHPDFSITGAIEKLGLLMHTSVGNFSMKKPAFAGFGGFCRRKHSGQIKLAESGGFEPPIELLIL
jgi:hypothetical protein